MDLIEALQLQKPDVLGWSLGGYILLTLVVNYPTLIGKIILADTSAGGALGDFFSKKVPFAEFAHWLVLDLCLST